MEAELEPAPQTQRASQVGRERGVDRLGQRVARIVALDDLIVGEVEKQADTPAQMKRHRGVLVDKTAFCTDGGREAFGIEALPRCRAAHTHYQRRCQSSHTQIVSLELEPPEPEHRESECECTQRAK